MKTKNPFAKAFAFAIAFLLSAFAATMSAQITASPYKIANLTNCTIGVTYTVRDGSSCSIICGPTYVNITGTSSFPVPCGNVGDDVEVSLDDIGACGSAGSTNSVSGGPCVFPGLTATYDRTCCQGVAGNIKWTGSACIIN